MKKAITIVILLALVLALLPGCGGSRRLEAAQRAGDLIELTAFTRSGLIAQLEAEGFSRRDAEAGVDSLNIDWIRAAAVYAYDHPFEFLLASDEQAVAKLQVAGFSRLEATQGWSLLMDTLNSDAG